ncbi:flagellar basal body rod C-terminal domain-containing protein [Sneathiella sp.]|uniref:flagellar basal body rod C-terminal domain-containing protein n=1 Tax=Sneathiella sp. TaxID=1964365 RepID=UPI00356A8362
MLPILGSALSGMDAATKRIDVSAQNIVNVNSVGTKSEQTSYKAVEAIQTSDGNGAPTVTVRERTPSTVTTYAPNSLLANADGLVESPNVDIASELVSQDVAVNSYKASVKMFQVWDEMQKATLDITS